MPQKPQGDPAVRRSQSWFDDHGRSGMINRGAFRSMGLSASAAAGRPIIGIGHSASELVPCNSHLARLAEMVAKGVWQAGGVPLIFPTMALGEQLMRPTAMLFRNLMAMEVEEVMRANPLDGVVLLSSCDKTTPAMLMASASVDLPTIVITGGPKLNGKYQGRDLGSGTSLWRFEQELRTGQVSQSQFEEADTCMYRSDGHCMTMGTASTMACLVEVLGMSLPGMAALPASDTRRFSGALESGHRIVAMVSEDLVPSRIMTRTAFRNAIRVNAAIGGSTNAIVHMLALAGRLGIGLELSDFDRWGRDVPLLADLMPSGRFLMEDLCYAGGLGALMNRLGDLLDRQAITVSGHTLGDEVADQQVWSDDVIRPLDNPVSPAGTATAVLTGTLSPSGSVMKVSAASEKLLVHRGRAVVFESSEQYASVVDDIELDASDVIVLRNAGPRGFPGMPEVANVPLPTKLLKQGVTDMVRISDGRMSGTAYGTVVLHVAPEAAVGGPLAAVRDGDWIEVNVPARTLHLDVPDDEIQRRLAETRLEPPASPRGGGYTWLYREHVTQADTGADFDFLVGNRGRDAGRASH
jgi:dihydroxy-acid dehydratase